MPLFLPEWLPRLVEDFEPRQLHVGQIALAQTLQLKPRLNAPLPFGASNLQSAAVQSEPFDTDMGNHSAHVGGINRSERARPVLNSRRSMSARSNALNRKSHQEDLELCQQQIEFEEQIMSTRFATRSDFPIKLSRKFRSRMALENFKRVMARRAIEQRARP